MFLVKSKARIVHLREGAGGKMRTVGPREWQVFDALPSNLMPSDGVSFSDADLEIKAVADDKDVDAALAENERMAKSDADAAKARKAPKVAPPKVEDKVEDKPKKSKKE